MAIQAIARGRASRRGGGRVAEARRAQQEAAAVRIQSIQRGRSHRARAARVLRDRSVDRAHRIFRAYDERVGRGELRTGAHKLTASPQPLLATTATRTVR